MQHSIDLTPNSDGVYEYLDNSFHPVDGLLFGNEGQSHNNYFTYSINTSFKHHACDGRFLDFQGCDDAWMFVNGRLAMDLGGVNAGTSQHVDFNRLNLVDGKTYTLDFFYAQRNPSMSMFRIRTNLDFNQVAAHLVISGAMD
jgi:fibro-slime domain-containing protein